ncbi:MAG TPA: NmrA family NAD(P)-binding protein [Terriglobales bacterium]|nr:NmrA family NAD(P)-binding protein [Terriglobales bacterium]
MYVVTGASGHTGCVVAKNLLKNGAKVRVIGRNPEHLKNLAAEGAEPFAADLTDVGSVTKGLAGAKAAYVMMPPNIATSDLRAFQNRVADVIANAIKNAGVTHVVTLSSVGADKTDRTGPVVGLHNLEQQLNRIDPLNVLHLRAGYFMENTLAQIGIIQQMGMVVGPLRSDLRLPMIATRDIGEAAANALLSLGFRQKQARELLGQRDISMSEAAQIIGRSIGKPDLRYVQAPDEQVRPALIQLGMSANMTDLILEMSGALNSGHMRALEPRSAENTTPTSYETFVTEEFVPLYERQSAAA